VRDSGPGLSQESLGRLFDPFYTTKRGGMGMGLSICRSIIEAHGGQVGATANVPRGATRAREACVREERVGYRPTSARPCAADLARATGQRSRA
jgi:signal transduction histidine kinase